jgi:hypothetical protein
MPDYEVFDEIPQSLISTIKDGNAIFFIGAEVLDPPRYIYQEDIEFLFTKDLENYQFFHKFKKSYPNMKEQLGQSKKRDNVNLEKIDQTIDSMYEIANTISSQQSSSDKQQDNFIQFNRLSEFINKTWPPNPIPYLTNILSLVNKPNYIITTLFDNKLENSFYNNLQDKELYRITGKESILNYQDQNFIQDNYLVLFHLLGTLDKPDMLCLSTKTTEIDSDFIYNLSSLRRGFESNSKFLKNICDNKTLVLLGYKDKDIYDSFFREVLNDLHYVYERPITKEIYFVGEKKYDSFYGTWDRKKEKELKIISMYPEEYLKNLSP